MTHRRARHGPHDPEATDVAHGLPEQLVDRGEVPVNHVVLGEPGSPALLLIPGQTESWWGYEAVLPRLAEHFQVFADARLSMVRPEHLHDGSDDPSTPEVAADASLQRLAEAGDPPASLLARLGASTERLLHRT